MLNIDLFTHITKYLDDKSICNISLTNRYLYSISVDEKCYKKGKYIVENKSEIFGDLDDLDHQIVHIDLIYIKQLWNRGYKNDNPNLYFDIMNSCAKYGKIDCIDWMYKNKIGCDDLYETLRVACMNGKVNIAKWFYKNKIIEIDEDFSEILMTNALVSHKYKMCNWIHANQLIKDYPKFIKNLENNLHDDLSWCWLADNIII